MLEESTLTQHLSLVNCILRCTASIWLVIRTNLNRPWGIHICGGWEVPSCAVEDVNDLWESVKEKFEARLPFKRASLNNKARNLVFVDKLHVDYVQTTDARLRRGLPGEQIPLPLWFRRPYACVVLVTCEVSLFLLDFSSYSFFCVSSVLVQLCSLREKFIVTPLSVTGFCVKTNALICMRVLVSLQNNFYLPVTFSSLSWSQCACY